MPYVLHRRSRGLVCVVALALLASVPLSKPQPAVAAPSALQMIQATLRAAIAAAPGNFASVRDESSADPDMGIDREIKRDYHVSAAIQAGCPDCDMGVTYWDESTDTRSGAITPEYWEFNLGIGIGTLDRAAVPAALRKYLGPAIPKAFSYAGVYSTDSNAGLQNDEYRWNGPSGSMIRVVTMLSGFGTNKRVAVVYVRHTP